MHCAPYNPHSRPWFQQRRQSRQVSRYTVADPCMLPPTSREILKQVNSVNRICAPTKSTTMKSRAKSTTPSPTTKSMRSVTPSPDTKLLPRIYDTPKSIERPASGSVVDVSRLVAASMQSFNRPCTAHGTTSVVKRLEESPKVSAWKKQLGGGIENLRFSASEMYMDRCRTPSSVPTQPCRSREQKQGSRYLLIGGKNYR